MVCVTAHYYKFVLIWIFFELYYKLIQLKLIQQPEKRFAIMVLTIIMF